ncbi:MAG: hypothetical protein KME49_06535 [Brasilonema octagenarum HA4186-MV1]|nr:hypothetical protein [Brasilonema octagenarum HA4186-MV1]
MKINEPPRRASAYGGFPSVGDWRRQERQEKKKKLMRKRRHFHTNDLGLL